MTADTMKESQLQKLVIELARRRGWRVAHFRTAQSAAGNWITPVQGDGKGWPDLFCVKGKKMIAVELKAKYRKPTDEQVVWLEALAAAGVDVHLVYPQDWDSGLVDMIFA